MVNSDPKEILVGDTAMLDHLAQKYSREDVLPHPLQKKIEELIETQLTDNEQEIFYLRFGERMSIRKIAEQLGYTSHQIIQVKLERIKDKIKKGLDGLL